MPAQRKICRINDVCYSLGVDWVVQLELEGVGRVVIKGKSISSLSEIPALTDHWEIEQIKGCYIWVEMNNGRPVRLSHLTRDYWVDIHRFNG